MKKRVYGFGIVGLGAITEFHAKTILSLSNARLVAGFDLHLESARAFAKKFSCDFTSSLNEMLNREDIDIVSICTPPKSHCEIASAAAKAGKHVICEKPLAISIEQADNMIEAHNKSGTILGGIFQLRFTDPVQTIKKALEMGRFGRLSFISGYVPCWRTDDYFAAAPWRGEFESTGGGALMSHGIHTIDLLLYLGGDVVRVNAFSANIVHNCIEIEDTFVASIEYANCSLGNYLASTSMYPGAPARIEIAGDSGMAFMEGDVIKTWSFKDECVEDADIRKRFSMISTSNGGASIPLSISYEPFRRYYSNFLEALDSNSEPLVSGREARRSIELVTAMYESARTGKAVILPFIS